MKKGQKLAETRKIYACIDQLLMQDVTFNDSWKTQVEHSNKVKSQEKRSPVQNSNLCLKRERHESRKPINSSRNDSIKGCSIGNRSLIQQKEKQGKRMKEAELKSQESRRGYKFSESIKSPCQLLCKQTLQPNLSLTPSFIRLPVATALTTLSAGNNLMSRMKKTFSYQYELDQIEQQAMKADPKSHLIGQVLNCNVTAGQSNASYQSNVQMADKSKARQRGTISRIGKQSSHKNNSKHHQQDMLASRQQSSNSFMESFSSDQRKTHINHKQLFRTQQVNYPHKGLYDQPKKSILKHSSASYNISKVPNLLISSTLNHKQKHSNKLKVSSVKIKAPFQQVALTEQQPAQQEANFNLSHEQLQFLSLLYPNESPQELMIKLLAYYEEQQQYKNSFRQILYRQRQISRKRQNQGVDVRMREQSCSSQQNIESDKVIIEKDKYRQTQTTQQQVPMFIQYHQSYSKDSNGLQHKKLNPYTRLKEQCLAALGSQMVQKQVQNSCVETSNVNFYTRQYAMPQIVEMVRQKNQQAQEKLINLDSDRDQSRQPMTEPPKATMTMRTFQSIVNASKSSASETYVHKVYIPANVRGQGFDVDFQPDGILFEFLPENDCRRTFRDINHLIQKVLLYHRHGSFLKKKNSYLFKGWNLALFLFMVISLVPLSVESLVMGERDTSYIQVVVFFCLSFILILILGNAFNNYRKDVKRSSLIKDICEQIKSYFQFINRTNKMCKWVLGNDFFWIQIWIIQKRSKF